MRLVIAVLSSLALSLLSLGCSGADGGAPLSEASGAPTSASPAVETAASHCAKVTRVESDAPITELFGDGMTLPAADFVAAEPTGTVLVLLHQTGAEGLCGWATFATQAAAAGFSSVVPDLCGYGAASCDQGKATPPEAQVALAVAHARDDLGAQRIALVGASMGGSQTVIAVARGADVDAWADLSGPEEWNGVRLSDLTADVAARGLPALMMRGPDDSDALFKASEALAAATGAEFVGDGNDHGWAMLDDHGGDLLPAGRRLLDFLTSLSS